MIGRDWLQIASFIPVIGILAGYRLFKRRWSSWVYHEPINYLMYQAVLAFFILTLLFTK